jgi:hypothetical protein
MPDRRDLGLHAVSLTDVVGAVLVLIALFVVGPIALFLGGAIWSALAGFLMGSDADDAAEAAAQPSA